MCTAVSNHFLKQCLDYFNSHFFTTGVCVCSHAGILHTRLSVQPLHLDAIITQRKMVLVNSISLNGNTCRKRIRSFGTNELCGCNSRSDQVHVHFHEVFCSEGSNSSWCKGGKAPLNEQRMPLCDWLLDGLHHAIPVIIHIIGSPFP